MQVNYGRGGVTIKPTKRELNWMDNMLGLLRNIEHSRKHLISDEAKAAADALEKVRARFTEEATT